MFIKLDANLILIFSYIINISNSLNIIDLNNLLDISAPDNKIADNERIIQKTRTKSQADKSHKYKQKYQNTERLKKFREPNNYNSKVLVKRIIPHGLQTTGWQYDHKHKTLYKPLVRIHKRKQNLSLKGKDENEISFIIAKEPKLKHFKLNKIDDNIDQVLIAPFKLSKSETGDELEVLKKLQRMIKNINSRTSRLKAYDKTIKLINNILRKSQFEKSGEENDPLAPGKVILADERDVVTEKQKVWMPHYAPWNYWTYKKTIHQDPCPGGQVKVGNMCIWIPPH